MGGGQSNASASVEAHLSKWESALAELEEVARSNRRAMEHDRIYTNTGSSTDQRPGTGEDGLEPSLRGGRHLSQVSFGTSPIVQIGQQQKQQLPPAQQVLTTVANTSQRLNQMSMEAVSRTISVGVSYATPANNNISNADVSKLPLSLGPQPKHSRQQVLEIRKARMNFFNSYELERPEEGTNLMECSHFGAAAVALSYLLGGEKGCKDRKKRVTVEDIFFAAHVPLHYLHGGVQGLPVMSDIIRDFIGVDNRFKNDYGLSAMHLDISPALGQVELGNNDVGDRQRRMQLPEFSKVITHDCEEETQVIRIVNYDPYVLEQETLVDAFDDEDEEHSALAASALVNARPAVHCYPPNNSGAYAVIVDVRNVVQLMVTLAEGVVGESLHVTLMEVPAAALYKAMTVVKDGCRARGFIRIFRKDCVPVMMHDEVPLMFTPELSSGKVIGSTLQGIHASVVSTHISPHIAAVSWAMHLLGGVRPNSHGYGNGLPVSDIIRKMCFPADVLIDGSLPLGEVFRYARKYVRITNLNYNVSVCPVLTKISRDNAVPTISIFELESIIIDVKDANEDPEVPEHIMAIMYNANVAHNVLHISHFPQWCLLAGYDVETQMVLLIDAHPKTFMQTWTCPLDRLHKAMTSNGYIIFSKSREVASRNKSSESSTCGGSQLLGFVPEPSLVGAPRRIASTVQNRLELLHEQETLGGEHTEVVKTFHFPSLPLSSTMMALALTKLGIFTTFEDVVMTLPFEISSLMLRYFTVESLAVCLTTYTAAVGLSMEVQTYHTDRCRSGAPRLPWDDFKQLVVESVDNPNRVLFVLFNKEKIEIFGVAHPFGSTGIVIGYNPSTESVTVMDSNPHSYFRTWPVPLRTLHDVLLEEDAKHRRSGCITLTRCEGGCESRFPLKYTRDFPLHILPVQNIFHVSPSPHFQALSMAFAQLGFFYSPEEIFYEAYLKTMADQRRRGSQAFAWRDVDVSLTVINKQIDARFLAQVCRMFIESRNPTNSSTKGTLKRTGGGGGNCTGDADTIQVELLEDIELEELDTILMDATRREGNNSVLLLNYDTAKAHDVEQWGRSLALVKSFNPETEMVELMEGEHTVFGLVFTVNLAKLIEIGDLHNEGRSAYGFVKLERVKERTVHRRLTLMRGPDPDDEEPFDGATSAPAHQGFNTTVRRSREMVAKFLGEGNDAEL
ncbi:hypothetical protein TraAM80_09208 [Trypanosoma rangeli]|uniref:Uncharacterized protein n=1 Tax=Trypanosoma rangeli TaxID=5698 RepID=A0A3R7LI08_TRYRA|nr:uncharacterized protein TraAM80_09208 [Trypanosoma rangeli]RNE97646.1 hypothetical protein TraAM80_09208 [Trypanosoma rangeli]|eukprot:RNE97646.1 hypothetical protein TraAM80_09208 [Trypanosoma rangeli]